MGCFIQPLTHLLGIYRRGLPWAVKPEGFAHNNYVLLTGLFCFISLRDSFASLRFYLSIATKVIKTKSAPLCLWWRSGTVVVAGPCKARTAKEVGADSRAHHSPPCLSTRHVSSFLSSMGKPGMAQVNTRGQSCWIPYPGAGSQPLQSPVLLFPLLQY